MITVRPGRCSRVGLMQGRRGVGRDVGRGVGRGYRALTRLAEVSSTSLDVHADRRDLPTGGRRGTCRRWFLDSSRQISRKPSSRGVLALYRRVVSVKSSSTEPSCRETVDVSRKPPAKGCSRRFDAPHRVRTGEGWQRRLAPVPTPRESEESQRDQGRWQRTGCSMAHERPSDRLAAGRQGRRIGRRASSTDVERRTEEGEWLGPGTRSSSAVDTTAS